VLRISDLDLGLIATALADQSQDEHRWYLDPRTGGLHLWTVEGGLDGDGEYEIEDEELLRIEALPTYVWYQDMADFAAAVTDEAAADRLARAIQGKGAFRRFRSELHERYPELLAVWKKFTDARSQRRAVDWLLDAALVDEQEAESFRDAHPDPAVP
jgi:hypothetical protein